MYADFAGMNNVMWHRRVFAFSISKSFVSCDDIKTTFIIFSSNKGVQLRVKNGEFRIMHEEWRV